MEHEEEEEPGIWMPVLSFQACCETAKPQTASRIKQINLYLFKSLIVKFYLHLQIFLTDTNSFHNNGLVDSSKFPFGNGY